MSYQEALEAAGAEVIEFECFGSYQGEWWAKVIYGATTGWVNGYYGSCSGCDAFEAEFGYFSDEDDDYNDRLIAFGQGYIEDIMTQEQAITKASENIDWDMEAQEMVNFIRNH